MSERPGTTDVAEQSSALPGGSADPGVTPGPDDGVEGVVSRVAVVHATPAVLFALLSDARRHPELDGSGTVRGPLGSVGKLYLGRKFTMRMHNVVPYLVPSTVVDFDTDRLIAWRHAAGHVWRWQLAAGAPGTTVVTETFDPRPSPLRPLIARAGSGNGAGIEATLRRLQERFPG